ncbi:MAG: hypothetical protein LBL99_01995, partial [Holosporaceae bacterium]|nr:hypothetical protein [Holosporaceae bacterium]
LNAVNSALFALLIAAIFGILFKVYGSFSTIPRGEPTASNIFAALPVMFTSFGVQNVCPYVYEFLDRDAARTKKAFLVGASITSLVYLAWICAILCAVSDAEPAFYARILGGKANSGELIDVICKISGSNATRVLIKGLSLTAIATSAIGFAVGLGVSLTEILRRDATFLIAAIPTAIAILIPNAFINVLSFGGAIATVFTTFIPIYLRFLTRKKERCDATSAFCVAFAIAVVIGEFLK